ncbi:DNA polymerase I [Vibrio phage CHOED]|uniref:DNA polymerase I n=1 Tax=Vibrio phage CHOED TaxID=1458716 RepID=UPI00042F0D5E|nr:DNA polymerase I [Vibrio phage CHOED]AHK11901.1 DNA polymerase [Vibrio phage CHOED]
MEIDFKFELNPLWAAMKKRFCFDIEANGLLKEVSLFFCAVVEDVDTGDIWYYDPDQMSEFCAKLDEAHWIIGHNIIGYDLPAMKKLHGWEPREGVVIYDTLIASRMFNPNLERHPDCPQKVWNAHNESWKNVGPHTLMNLGYIVGEHKDSFGEDKAFHEYCPEMLTYCAQDVRVNVKIFHWLRRQMKGWDDLSIQLEMEVAEYICWQMREGWWFNIEAADTFHNTLQVRMHELEDQVRAVFQPIYKPKTTLKDEEGNSVPKEVQPRVTQKGVLSSVGLKNIFGVTYDSYIPIPEHRFFVDHVEYYSGAFTPVVTEEFNLGSRQQISERLQRAGWVPTKFTDKGNVIIDDEVLESLGDSGIPEGVLLQEYFKVSKILSMVGSWMEHYDWDTGAIHGYVNSVGAVTNRMTHSNPNVAQVPASATTDVHGLIHKGGKIEIVHEPKKGDPALCLMTYDGKAYPKGALVAVDVATMKPVKSKLEPEDLRSGDWDEAQFAVAAAHGEILIWGIKGGYGADCRDLFCAPEGYTVVGADASGLELRCLAHYMNDPEYTDLILHGDIHSHNQMLAGLEKRGQAKTFIYAFLYGAGNEKIGSIVVPYADIPTKKAEGAKLKKRFLKGLPKLERLITKVTETVESRGMRGTATVKGIDGRRIRIRAAYAALNSLLQSCGAVVCKVWLLAIVRNIHAHGIDARLVASVHDEYQFIVRDDHVEALMEICEATMPLVGEAMKFRCPLASEAKAGRSWAETH